MSHPTAPDGRGWPSPGDARGYSGAADRGRWPAATADDGWGPATAVRAGSADRVGRAFNPPAAAGPDAWSPGGPLAGRDQRAARAADRRTERSVLALQAAKVRERGLPWWAALLVLILIAGVGGVIDTLGSNQVKGGFNIGIVVASVVAVLAVKRSHMFPVVIAPPIVYSVAAVFQLYVRSSGLHDKKVVLDAAANYLVYGFPAIAAASAAVLIIAGVRLISRK